MNTNNSHEEAAKQRGNSAGSLAIKKVSATSKNNFGEVAMISISSISGGGSLERFNRQS